MPSIVTSQGVTLSRTSCCQRLHWQRRGLIGYKPQPKAARQLCRASLGDGKPSQEGGITKSRVPDSDAAFFIKLLVVSLSGGALIKYGSLLTPFAFQPSPDTALALVFSAVVVYAARLLLYKEETDKK